MTTREIIENTLLPAVQIEGQPLTGMNLHDRMAYYRVPGISIAVVNNGHIEWSQGYGLVEAGAGKPITPQTLFQAASISKPVSALAAMALVQAGLLELDRDVNEVLKSWQVPPNEFTEKEKVTLRRLLSHNAGLTVHGFEGYREGAPLPTVQQVLLGAPPANSPPVVVDVLPGSIWRYSGGGTTVAQLMMMEATGLPYHEIMRRYVLEPAGMLRSTYEHPLPAARRGEPAIAHNQAGEPIAGGWHTYPEQGAASLWTTPEDLCRYIIELQKSWHGQSNKILSQEWTREMLSVQFANWGIGPKISGTGDAVAFSHGGSNAGYRCEMIGFIHTGQGIAVMTNSDNGGSLVMEVIRAAASVYGWQDYLPALKKAIELPAAELKNFVGKYTFPEFAEVPFEIVLVDNRLCYNSQPFNLQENQPLFAQSPNSFFDAESGFEFDFAAADKGLEMTLRVSEMEFKAHKNEEPG